MATHRFGRRFDALAAIPLVLYVGAIAWLVLGLFAGMTRDAVRTAFSDPALLHSIWLSLATSAASTVVAMLAAIPAGYLMSRWKFPGHAAVDTLIDMPIVLPPLVMGLALLIFFSTAVGRFLDRGIWPQGIFVYHPGGIVLAQIVVGTAFAIRVVKAGFDAFDAAFEDVAMTLGANRWQAFRKAVLPNVMPSLVAGAVMSWAKIFGLFGPILMVAGTMRGRTEIMPTTIFLETSIGRIEVALVVGCLMILMSMATLLALKKLGSREVAS